jgi:hypothetical protein
MSNKPASTKSIEQALGISDSIAKMEVHSSDDEKKKQFEERQNKLKKIQEAFVDKKKTYENDKEFIKDMLRELAETAMTGAAIMKEEAGMTGDYKNVESLATATNAAVSALTALQNVELEEERIRIEHEKVNIRKVASENGSILGGTNKITQNNVFVGSHAELLKALKNAENIEKDKVIDVVTVADEEKK